LPQVATIGTEGGVNLLQGLAIFALAAFAMAFVVLVAGKLLRTRVPHPDKATAYECGEPPIGPGWVQFDLRFYVVALVFLIFDVEIALFYPWAVVYGGGASPGATGDGLRQVRWAAMWDMLFFFAVIVVGFIYLWRFGYLNWVRAMTIERGTPAPPPEYDRSEA
jgi:NADH-quinone oxidoreductase subunit A